MALGTHCVLPSFSAWFSTLPCYTHTCFPIVACHTNNNHHLVMPLPTVPQLGHPITICSQLAHALAICFFPSKHFGMPFRHPIQTYFSTSYTLHVCFPTECAILACSTLVQRSHSSRPPNCHVRMTCCTRAFAFIHLLGGCHLWLSSGYFFSIV